MSELTVEQYELQKSKCNGLCDIDNNRIDKNNNVMPCVTCPFCNDIVDAILTPTTISCPSCKTTVLR